MDLDDVDDCPPCPKWFPDRPASEDQDRTTEAEAEAFRGILARLKEDLDKKDLDDRYTEAQMPPRDTDVHESESESESEPEDLQSKTEVVPELERADSRLSCKLSFMPLSQAQVNQAYRV